MVDRLPARVSPSGRGSDSGSSGEHGRVDPASHGDRLAVNAIVHRRSPPVSEPPTPVDMLGNAANGVPVHYGRAWPADHGRDSAGEDYRQEEYNVHPMKPQVMQQQSNAMQPPPVPMRKAPSGGPAQPSNTRHIAVRQSLRPSQLLSHFVFSSARSIRGNINDLI